MPGYIAPGFHEGSRSEYLAQYVFAMIGTAAAIPHQEDSGVDLHCTLTETIGRRERSKEYFSVQVKSDMSPWVFDDHNEVRWLVEHPLPIFLCVVDKKAATLRVYHTFPRFYVWASGSLPPRLELWPGSGPNGGFTRWEGDDSRFTLGAPIWEATIEELLDDSRALNVKNVMRAWTDLENDNLTRIREGIHQFRMPDAYETNNPNASCGGDTFQGTTRADLSPTLARFKESIGNLTLQLRARGDFEKAVRCALVARCLFPEETSGLAHNFVLLAEINDRMNVHDGAFAGADELNRLISERLARHAAPST